MIVKFDIPLFDLDGAILQMNGKEAITGKVIADILANCNMLDNAIKCYDLAVQFHSLASFEIEPKDLGFVRDVVSKAAIIPLVKGPILKGIDSALSPVK